MYVHIFDCDGVITDTNKLKTNAFEHVSKKYLHEPAQLKLLEYHNLNGGKSRWEKFKFVKEYFSLAHIDIDFLCQEYSEFVEISMFRQKLVPKIYEYIKEIHDDPESIIYVASAGETNQVQRLIKFHKLPIESRNIFGSPEKKLDIAKKIKGMCKSEKILFYGDSYHDAECAHFIEAKMIFIKGFTSVSSQKIKNNFPKTFVINDFQEFDLQLSKSFFNHN